MDGCERKAERGRSVRAALTVSSADAVVGIPLFFPVSVGQGSWVPLDILRAAIA